MSWDAEKVEKLKELWGKGFTASQIAEILGGVSRNAVIGKAHRLNLSGKIITKKGSINQKNNKSKSLYFRINERIRSTFRFFSFTNNTTNKLSFNNTLLTHLKFS